MFYKRGLDFDVLFDMRLAKGAFGTVSYSCFVDRAKNKSGVAIKRIDFTASRKAKQVRSKLSVLFLQYCFNLRILNKILSDKSLFVVFDMGKREKKVYGFFSKIEDRNKKTVNLLLCL